MLLVRLCSPPFFYTLIGRTGIHVTGKLSDWATTKDLILHLAGKLTVKVSSWTS